jgi:hypothetical protein
MKEKDDPFLYKCFDSYEKFRQEILEEDNFYNVNEFLFHLRKIPKEEKKIKLLYKVKYHGSRQSFFFKNMLWLYRWLISDGYQKFSTDIGDVLFEFLSKLDIPTYAMRENRWGVPLLKPGRANEDFWKNRILKYYVKTFDKNFISSEVVNLWLLYHIGLRQLFPGSKSGGEEGKPEGGKISDTMEIVLTNYMNLIEEFFELEETFGVTIEKDLYRIYEMFGGGKKNA